MQRLAGRRRRLLDRRTDQSRLDLTALPAHLLGEAQQQLRGPGRASVGREGTQALPADDGALRGQRPDRLPDRHARDAVPGGEFGLGRQSLPGGPFTGIESHPQVVADADVHWPVHRVPPGLSLRPTGCRASHPLGKCPHCTSGRTRPRTERDTARPARPGPDNGLFHPPASVSTMNSFHPLYQRTVLGQAGEDRKGFGMSAAMRRMKKANRYFQRLLRYAMTARHLR